MELKSKNYCPEIVSPAGNLLKLKFAIAYGADAVYFGGNDFNLRNLADNFSLEDLAEAKKVCLENNVKSVFLLNSFLHQKNVVAAKEYIKKINSFGFDAYMVSDPGMLMLIRESGYNGEIHLSTQMSTLNSIAVKFWQDAGVNRIVMARETTLDEVKQIKNEIDADLEMFVHGALCVAYSGRCLLSRYMAGRDANQGACAQPCRWNYSLVEESRPGKLMDVIEYKDGSEILSSKDLCMLNHLKEFVDAGVNAFKIEGRMKSLYYVSNVTRIYKQATQLALAGKDFSEFSDIWAQELDLVTHRPYTDDLFNEFDEKGYYGVSYINRVMFMGCVHADQGQIAGSVPVQIFNPIRPGDEMDFITPDIHDNLIENKLLVKEIYDQNGVLQKIAKPKEIYDIVFDKKIRKNSILRKRK